MESQKIINLIDSNDNESQKFTMKGWYKKVLTDYLFLLLKILVQMKLLMLLRYEIYANRVIRDSYRKYFVPRVDITSYNVLIDGRNFYDQPTNDSIRKYDEIRKIATGKGDNYATGCLLDYDYFKKNYQLIAIDLSKQRELDADPRAIQQIEFIGMLKTRSNVFKILEKSSHVNKLK